MNGLAIILAILKFLGILLLVVLFLVLLASAALLFVPVRYVVEFQEGKPVRLGFRVSWFLKAIQIRKSVSEDKVYIHLLGMDVRNLKKLFRREKKQKKEHKESHETRSPVELVDDLYDEEKKPEDSLRKEQKGKKVHVKTDYENKEAGKKENKEKTSRRNKKSFSFNKISSIITFIRSYEHRSGLYKIKKEFIALFRYLMPDKIHGRISFGTGDPCTTGWILGAVSMFRVAYTDGLTVLPHFEEKIFVAEGYVKGKVYPVYFLRLFMRGYMDDDIKRCIRHVLKMI